MRTLYLDCGMGVAGDMFTMALLEFVGDKAAFLEKMNSLGLPGVVVPVVPAARCDITGTHVAVTICGKEEVSYDVSPERHIHYYDYSREHGHEYSHEHEHGHEREHHHHDHDHRHHHHTGMGEIRHLLGHLELPEAVRVDTEAVYGLIAETEGHTHGASVGEVHFHEVGSLDVVANVAGVCLPVHMLGVECVVASLVRVGSGQVRCAHDILPVPASAATHILQDVSICSGTIHGGLCAPTGAALLRHFVTGFGAVPVMKVEEIDYNMGNKDFKAANYARALLGGTAGGGDGVVGLCYNLDDTTAGVVDLAQGELLIAGALGAYTTPTGMKKDRPAVLFSCMCRMEDWERLFGPLFRHTTTLGVRENMCRRYTLEQSERTVDTLHDPVRLKIAFGWGVVRPEPECKDVTRIARGQGTNLAKVLDWLK